MLHRTIAVMLCLAGFGLSDWLATAAEPAAVPLDVQRHELAASCQCLRQAIEDLRATFGDRYAKAGSYLAQLGEVEQAATAADTSKLPNLRERLDALRSEALRANPLVSGQPLVYVVRQQYRNDHHNTATMFQTGEINTGSFQGGGALKTLDVATGQSRTVVDVPKGVARDPDVSFDGRKILFSMRRDAADDYHVFEVNPDGSGLTQLTFGSGLSDIDPMYLPDGRIVFTSTREPKYCMCNRHAMGNLYVMNGDGSNVEQIGHSTLHEGHPSLMADGRVIYDRWEYVDRNFGDAQGLWTVNPDGTNHAVYWGNNTNSPGAVLDARPIPGTEQVLVTFSSCHDRPWGAIAIVDRRLGLDGKTPTVRTWPEGAVNLIGVGNYDTFKQVQPKYEDPYPLSDKYFLCSRMTGRGEQMGIVLIDVFGNERLLHTEGPGCFDPMPLAERPKPPALPSRTDAAQREGLFYVEDVYRGTGMDRVPRGTVRWLRVVESPEKRFWTGPAWDGGTGQQAPGMAWDDFNNKRILGTVPVQADGSAYFSVPADTFVYFQLLDERGMMVQSMRSGTIVRPGERTGCVGCHEDRRATLPLGERRLAALGPPERLKPWYGPPRLFSFTAEVQPVLDKHCVRCHDYGTEGGKRLNLAGDLGLVFNTSYIELRKKTVHVVGAGPYAIQPPKSWGSHASRLARVVLEGHERRELDRDIHMTPEDIDRVITWIDINAPYYPEYAGGAFRGNPYGRSPLNGDQLKRLSELTGMAVADRNQIAVVNFTRPELSSCLAGLAKEDPKYGEALAIIRTGRDRLAQHPRPDMPGFKLVDPVEINQEAKYQARLEQQVKVQQAMVEGSKVFSEHKPR